MERIHKDQHHGTYSSTALYTFLLCVVLGLRCDQGLRVARRASVKIQQHEKNLYITGTAVVQGTEKAVHFFNISMDC